MASLIAFRQTTVFYWLPVKLYVGGTLFGCQECANEALCTRSRIFIFKDVENYKQFQLVMKNITTKHVREALNLNKIESWTPLVLALTGASCLHTVGKSFKRTWLSDFS